MDTSYKSLAAFFKGLAHPTRLEILDLLREGEMCVCHIEAKLNRRQAYISQQLMALREAGLVDSRRDGLQVYYRLVDEHTAEVLNLMLGTIRPTSIQPIQGCACPVCSMISIADIQ